MLTYLLVTLLFIVAGCNPNGPDPDPDPDPNVLYKPKDRAKDFFYMPQAPARVSNTDLIIAVHTEPGGHMQQDMLLALKSFQGLINRVDPVIFTYGNSSEWLLEWYVDHGYIGQYTIETDVFKLLKDYKQHYSGVVIYDPEKRYTINLASNIAGSEDRIILSPDLYTRFRNEIDENVDVFDIRELNLEDQSEAFMWYRRNVLPDQCNAMLGLAKDIYMHDVHRDYLIEHNVPTFWLPGPDDPDFSHTYEGILRTFLADNHPNIPVLGFPTAADDNGTQIGYDEYAGVGLTGKYGMFWLSNSWVGNYSFHAAVPVEGSFSQSVVRNKTFRQYDSNKKYIALLMVDSGDAPAYFQYNGFFFRQWIPGRETYNVPASYGICMSLPYLMPALTQYIYDTQTENDYFFGAVSGIGYCYPLEGYGQLNGDEGENLNEMFTGMASTLLEDMDMDMFMTYTHPGNKLDAGDYDVLNNYMAKTEGVTSIICGLNRVGYDASNGHEFLEEGDVTIHQVLTRWSDEDFDLIRHPERDQEAVDFFVNEIHTYGVNGNFITAMFYSWEYGPKRLRMIMDELEPEGYVFVTANEFDALYRQSVPQALSSK